MVVAASPPAGVQEAVQGLVSGAIPHVRQGDRSYAAAAGYTDKAAGVPIRADDTYAIGCWGHEPMPVWGWKPRAAEL